MKKVAAGFLLLCITAYMLACGKVVEKLFPAIDVKLPAFQVTMPVIPVVTPDEVSLGTITARFNLDSAIRANTGGAFGASAISTIKAKQIAIDVPDADQGNNLSNFESAHFTLSSNVTSSPAEIATFLFPDTFANSSTTVPSADPELKSYFNSTEFAYSLFGKKQATNVKTLIDVGNRHLKREVK